MNYDLVITLTNGVEHEFMISIPDGVDGASFQAKGSVATKKDLPYIATAEIGDSYIVEGGPESEAGHLYILGTEKVSETASPHLEWIDMGRIVGRDGKDGTVADFDQNQFTTKVVDGKTVITIKNDPDSSNQLSVTGKEGLFVRPASAQVRAKDSSVRVAGIPQDENGGFNTEVSVNSIPVKNNQLGIRTVGSSVGLYVQSAHEELLSPNKTLSIKTSETVVPFEPAKTDIDVAISKAEGNALAVNEDGLFASSEGSPFVSIQPGYKTNVPAKSKVPSSIAIGESSEVDGNSALVIGARAKGKGDRNIIIGENANGNGSGQILIGSGVSDTWNNIIIGTNGSAKSGNSVLVGHGTKGAQKSIAIGAAARAEFEGAITIGESSVANVDEGIVLGAHASVSPGHDKSVAIGAGSLTTRKNTVSFGTASRLRTLEHVAAGTELTDAVNLGQLNTALQNFTPAISSASGNAIVAKEDGLYTPNAPKLVRKASSGNISWEYQDTPNSDNAAGKLGNGCYVKFPINFYNIKAGVTDFVPEVTLTRAPCNENGEIIPHQLYVTLATAYNNTRPKVQVTLIMERVPTHTIDTTSLKITPVGRNDNGFPVGIPEIPVVEGGTTIGNELGYRVGVMVNSTDVV